MKETQFIVRPVISPATGGIVFSVICEACGEECPYTASDSMLQIDRDAIGLVMFQHLDKDGGCSRGQADATLPGCVTP